MDSIGKITRQNQDILQQTESKEVIWFDNPWVWLDTTSKKIHKYFKQELI